MGNKEGRKVIWQGFCLSLRRLESGKDDSLSALKFKIWGSYLDTELSMFVKIFEFFLVTLSH